MDRILKYLRPEQPWDWLLYIIIVLAIIALSLQGKRGTLSLTVLMSVAILGAIVDKINIVNQQLFPNRSFTAYVVNIALFVSPTVFAGMTRASKSRGWAIGAALFGAIYLFGFWLVYQRQ